MADEEPPKPKPGSLKDRIKQFEQSSSSTAGPSAPPPLRPKPGALGQWKPKPLDPPSPNKQAAFPPGSQDTVHAATAADETVKHGMSATDAMSSITKGGGSLKERMAALQGKGAFGNPTLATAPPLPSNEGKPRVWRTSPAPPVSPKVYQDPSGGSEAADETHAQSTPSPHDEGEDTPQPLEGTQADGEPQTEEEQERERRAAIAARMARLGGARLGMPVGFGIAAKGLTGGKPPVPTKPKILTPGGHDSASPAVSPLSPGEEPSTSPIRKTTLEMATGIPLPKSQASLLSSDAPSDSDATASGKLVPPRSPSIPKSPDSMPIPALPKRTAGPRRKKSAKELKPTEVADDTPPAVPPLQSPTTEGDQAAALPEPEEYFPEETQKEDNPSEPVSEGKVGMTDDLISVPPSEAATPPPPSPSVGMTEEEEDDNEEDKEGSSPQKRPTLDIPEHDDEELHVDVMTPRPRSDSNDAYSSNNLFAAAGGLMQSDKKDDDEEEEKEETEEEEAARRKRIAEKMAHLGAVNPFSPSDFVSSGKESESAVVEEEEVVVDADKDESGKEEISKKDTDTDDKDTQDVAPNESETNVPVLSPSAFRSQAIQEHDESAASAKREDESFEPEEDDVDVDYPMMSPTGVAFGQGHVPFSSLNAIAVGRYDDDDDEEPHGAGVAKTSNEPEGEMTTHEQVEVYKTPDPSEDVELSYQDESNQYGEEEGEEEEEADQDDMRPARITRSVPPPPPARRSSSSSTGSRGSATSTSSPRKGEFDTRAQYTYTAAALSRRAPAPVPPHRSGSSSSVSPTSSPPPPTRLFEREGAPSPPSLKALSNIEDEDEDEDEYGEDDEEDVSLPHESDDTHRYREDGGMHHDHNGTRSSSPGARSVSSSPVPRPSSPPPVPTTRPPIPNIRRSIPPPPRPESPPSAPRSRPASRASAIITPVPRGSGDNADEDEHDKATIRKAAARPAMPPPPRRDEFRGKQKEVTDDEQGDPVDPGFVGNRHSPEPIISGLNAGGRRTPQRQSSLRHETRAEVTGVTQSSEQEDGDEEVARRQTIAERMAKLGGVKFGMAPPARAPPVRKKTEPKEEQLEDDSRDQDAEPNREEDGDQTPEENEQARRSAIAARMAAMGGRGFGMYGAGTVPLAPSIVNTRSPQPSPTAKAPSVPLAVPPPVPSSRPRTMTKEEVIGDAINRAPPAPPPIPQNVSRRRSEDTSESEIELVTAEPDEEGEMVEEEDEDEEPEMVETPPAPPARATRAPAPPTSRPPPPIPGQSGAGISDQSEPPPPLPSGRRAPPTRAAPPPASPPSEYDMLGEEPQVIPPPRRTHSRPPPALGSEPTITPSLDSSGQWELPNIPSGSFDLGTYGASKSAMEQDQSWTKVEPEDRSSSNAIPSTSTTASATEPFTGPSPRALPADRLASLARTMGPKVVQSAQHAHEKSKRLMIGDGSSTSFLYIVLAPIGASTCSLGYLVYAQTGGSVQKRLGDIMPGDVVALYGAHFKGHKGGLGLGGYSTSWGTKEEPVLGVISEFDAKKSKIRAFAVNQHPNSYPTIDTPSYKLDDLKSGTVKVFRVAEDSG